MIFPDEFSLISLPLYSLLQRIHLYFAIFSPIKLNYTFLIKLTLKQHSLFLTNGKRTADEGFSIMDCTQAITQKNALVAILLLDELPRFTNQWIYGEKYVQPSLIFPSFDIPWYQPDIRTDATGTAGTADR